MTIAIDYTSRFKLQTRDWVKYLSRDIGYRAAQRYVDDILDRFELRVSTFPKGCSQCAESEVVGFGHYDSSTKAQVRIILDSLRDLISIYRHYCFFAHDKICVISYSN